MRETRLVFSIQRHSRGIRRHTWKWYLRGSRRRAANRTTRETRRNTREARRSTREARWSTREARRRTRPSSVIEILRCSLSCSSSAMHSLHLSFNLALILCGRCWPH